MNDKLFALYSLAEREKIDIDWIPMKKCESVAFPFSDGSCCVVLDPWKVDTVEKEIVSIAHELGHCQTGSFYTEGSPCALRKRYENRADKWAIGKLITEEELDSAVANGYTEIYTLAEYFGVTEDFMKKIVCWYTYGNLATEIYF